MTGGGFGPLVVGGQIFSGIASKKAVGIASLAEGLTSLLGAAGYIYATRENINLSLTLSLLAGSITAIPLGAFLISKMPPLRHKTLIGVACIITGVITLIKFFASDLIPF